MNININPSLQSHAIQDTTPENTQTHRDKISTASLAAAALANARSEARNETLENASLMIASQAKKIQLGKMDRDVMVNGLQALLEQMDSMAKEMLNRVVSQLSNLKNSEDILNKLDVSGLSKGEIALALSSLLSYKGLDASVKKALKKRLQALMEEADIELEIMAATNGVKLNQESMKALKNLYQRAKSGEKGLMHWFDVLLKHEDRKKYLSILIRALTEPLHEGQKRDDLTMVAATVVDLRRMLLFLTFEDHCNAIARACKIDENSVKTLTLELLDQSWCYPDMIATLIDRVLQDESIKINFLTRLRQLFQLMSVDCFRDEEQKQHINDTLMQLSERWND